MEYSELVHAAKPYAKLCADFKAQGQRLARWADEQGEPALFLETKAIDKKRFPTSLCVWRMDPQTRESLPVAQFDLERPDYKQNDEGFSGNHLVIAVLSELKEQITLHSKLAPTLFTSRQQWSAFCSGPEYYALKEQRALDHHLLASPAAPKPPKKQRL